MGKINLLLFAIAFVAISCSEDNPAGSAMGTKGIYEVKMYEVPYDEQAQSWDEANKKYKGTLRLNADISARRARYDNNYGKNWGKGGVAEYMGALLASFDKDGNSVLSNKYDSNNYLIEKIVYYDSRLLGRRVYANENGKIVSLSYLEGYQSYVEKFEYGENGYIKNKFMVDPADTISRNEYYHDNNGFVIEKWYYFYQTTSDPLKTKYFYNNLGLLIRTENEDGKVLTEIKYNNLGLMIESINGSRTMQYKYNADGLPIESINYHNGNPEIKVIFVYD